MSTVSPLTIKALLTNPAGKWSRQIGARYAIKQTLNAIYNKLMLDHDRAGRFKLTVSSNSVGVYLVHITVPSTALSINYDVIFEISIAGTSIYDATVKIYCNSPGWIFTQGYVAAKLGFLATGWEQALGRARIERPRLTNPTETPSFDKIVYIAMLWMFGPGHLNTVKSLDAYPKTAAPNPNTKEMWGYAKLNEYERVKKAAAAEKAATKKIEKRIATTQKISDNKKIVKQVKAAKTTKTVGQINHSKNQQRKR